MGGATCESVGFGPGVLACGAGCTTWDTTQCLPPCGNDQVESGEICDGTDLDGEDCVSLGYDSGTLACLSGCRAFDTAACLTSEVCGNNTALGPEACDGSDLRGQTCASLGFVGGALSCAGNCTYDRANCVRPAPCDDGLARGLEVCDGTSWGIFGGPACSAFNLGDGAAVCTAACAPDLSGCSEGDLCLTFGLYNDGRCDACELYFGTPDLDCATYCPGEGTCANRYEPVAGAFTCTYAGVPDPDCPCGNGVAEYPEWCDGSDLQGLTCTFFRFAGGTLSCQPDCTPNFSQCVVPVCGNGVVDLPETCDGLNLNGWTCEALGFVGGELLCQSNCGDFDPQLCTTARCGNALREPREACDGSDLGGLTCASFGHTGGVLACATDCLRFDKSGCTGASTWPCGDGAVNGLEWCDGSAWSYRGGPACADLGLGAGNMTCSPTCTPDLSGCQSPDYCAANLGYLNGWCDACDLVGGTVDTECASTCGDDGACADYFDAMTHVHTCAHQALVDPNCTCGDGAQNGREWCDGADLTYSCVDLGFSGGPLACNPDCTFNYDGCRP